MKLIYRALELEYTPRPQTPPDYSVETQPVELFYRGETFTTQRPVQTPYVRPNALNWRFSLPAETAAKQSRSVPVGDRATVTKSL